MVSIFHVNVKFFAHVCQIVNDTSDKNCPIAVKTVIVTFVYATCRKGILSLF